jgi:hypothetical protein
MEEANVQPVRSPVTVRLEMKSDGLRRPLHTQRRHPYCARTSSNVMLLIVLPPAVSLLIQNYFFIYIHIYVCFLKIKRISAPPDLW